jgi:phytanoyl-CoA hydroxylase
MFDAPRSARIRRDEEEVAMESTALTREELQSYWLNGYVLKRGLIDPETVETLRARFQAVTHGDIPPARGMLVMRDVLVAKGKVRAATPEEEIAKIQDFAEDEVFFGYVKDDRILDVVESIIGPDIQTLHTMLINKPPNVDGRHPLHQDLVYFGFRPADKIVAAQTALEPMTRENGCLSVVPGSHDRGLIDHETLSWEGANAGYWGAKGVGAHPDRVHVELEPGDTLFFHPVLLHGSGRNRSAGFRRAISGHYASATCVRTWATPDEEKRQFRLVRGRSHDLAPPPADVVPPAIPIDRDSYAALRDRESRRG